MANKINRVINICEHLINCCPSCWQEDELLETELADGRTGKYCCQHSDTMAAFEKMIEERVAASPNPRSARVPKNPIPPTRHEAMSERARAAKAALARSKGWV